MSPWNPWLYRDGVGGLALLADERVPVA